MKFIVRIKVGVEVPGIGLTTKTKNYPIEAHGFDEAMNKAKQAYVDQFGREPSDFAQFSLTIALDTEAASGNQGAPAESDAGQ